MKHFKYFLATLLLLSSSLAAAASLQLQLQPDTANTAHPTIGDWMHFNSVITNTGQQPIKGLVAWISLVEVTPGKEQPMDLEDWSAHKAVTGTTLQPGAVLQTQWPMRLIQSGDYRVVISATDRKKRDRLYQSDTAIPCGAETRSGVRPDSAGRIGHSFVDRRAVRRAEVPASAQNRLKTPFNQVHFANTKF